VDWIHLAQARIQWWVGSCEHGSGALGSIKGRTVQGIQAGTFNGKLLCYWISLSHNFKIQLRTEN
jgi:hypothetical protein